MVGTDKTVTIYASVEEFVAVHGLNGDAVDVLNSLPPRAQDTVMKQFRPGDDAPSGTANINGKFIMFARSVERGKKDMSGKGNGKGGDMMGMWGLGGGWGGWGGGGWCGGPWTGMGPMGMGMGCWGGGGGMSWGKGGAKGVRGVSGGAPKISEDPNCPPPSLEELEVFCAQWILNEDAMGVMTSLPARVQHRVLRDFKGAGEPGSVNGQFILFARGVEARFHENKVGASAMAWGKGGAKGVKGFLGGPVQIPVDPNGPPPSPMELDVFCTQWALNEDAMGVLSSLAPTVQGRVLRDFKAEGEPGTVNGKFILFARGVEGRFHENMFGAMAMGKGGAKGVKGFLGGSAEIPFDPNFAPTSPMELEVFCTQWALNEDAVEVLNSLAPPVQSRVLRDFKGGGEPGSVNGKFILFARGVEKGGRYNVNGKKGSGGKGDGKGKGKGGFGKMGKMGKAMAMWAPY